MQQGQVEIEMAQGSMPRNTKNESRCVPSVTQWCRKGVEDLENQQFINKGLVPWGTQKDGLWRKVAGDLSTWWKEIRPFRKNDKNESSQKVSLKR